MSSISKLLAKFQQFEVDLKLFDLEWRGIKYWDLIRVFVYQDILIQKGLSEDAFGSFRQTKWGKFKKFGKLLSDLFSLNKFQLKEEYDFIVYLNTVNKNINGKNVCTIFYPVITALNNKYSFLIIDSNNDRSGYYSCDVKSYRFNFIISNIKSRFIKLNKSEINQIRKLKIKIEKEFHVSISIQKYMSKYVYYQAILAGFIEKDIKRYRAKALLATYNGRKFTFMAANKLGVPSIEFQHGLTHKNDPFYSYHSAIPKLESNPDKILTFGEYWNNEFMNKSQKISVGFTYFEQTLINLNKKSIRRKKNSLIAISTLDHKLLDCIAEFAKERPDYKIYYKLRPIEYGSNIKNKYSKVKNVHFIDHDNLPIIQYFMECEYAITSCSTAIYEAMAVGAYGIVFKGRGHEMLMELVHSRRALFAENSRELDLVLKSKTANISNKKEFYYKSNPLKNIDLELNKLIRSKKTHVSVV